MSQHIDAVAKQTDLTTLNSNLNTKANLVKTRWGTQLSVPSNQAQISIDGNVRIQVWLGGDAGARVWFQRAYTSGSILSYYIGNSTDNTITFGIDGADGTDFTITRSGSTFVLTTAASHTIQAFY